MAAQANEQELERLVVRLTGDGSSFQRMLQQAQDGSKQAAQAIQANGKVIEDLSKQIQGYASTAGAALAGLGAKGFLTSALGMYQETETATIKLRAAIQANGGAVEETLARYKEFSKEMKASTGASSDDTLALLKRAEAFGLTGEAAIRASKAAILLAKGGDADPQSALRITAQLEQGETKKAQMYSRSILALRSVKDETEFLNRVQTLQNIGQGQAAALMESTEGVFKRYHGTLKAITKQFGEVVAEGVKPLVKWATDLLKVFTDLDPVTKRLIVGAAFLVAGILAVGPAVATVQRWIMPVIQLSLAGVGAMVTVFRALLSPLALVQGAFVAIGTLLSTVFSPLGLLLLGASALTFLWVDSLGGLKPAWEKVKAAAMDAWAWIRSSGTSSWQAIKDGAQQFWAWLQPSLDWARAAFGLTWEAIKEFGPPAWEAVKDAMAKVWDWTKRVYDSTVGWAKDFGAQNKELLTTIGLVVGAVALAYGAFKILAFTVGLVSSVLTYFHVQQVIGAAAILLWKGVVLLASGVMLLWNASIWLVNLALATMNVLLAPVLIAAALGLWVAVGAAFLVVTAAAMGLYEGVSQVMSLLSEIPTTTGPIKDVGDLFSEWVDILKDVVRAAKVDMPLAWEVMKLGAVLAVEQVRALWPPLWAFIKEGFKALWVAFAESAEEGFLRVIDKAKFAGMRVHAHIFSAGRGSRDQKLAEIDAQEEAEKRQSDSVLKGIQQQADARIKAAQATYEVARAGGDNEAVKRAREDLDAARARIPEAEERAAKAERDAAKKGPEVLGNQYKKAADEIHKFDAALVGSAEATSRIRAYLDRLNEGQKAIDAANSKKAQSTAEETKATKEAQAFAETFAQAVGEEIAEAVAKADAQAEKDNIQSQVEALAEAINSIPRTLSEEETRPPAWGEAGFEAWLAAKEAKGKWGGGTDSANSEKYDEEGFEIDKSREAVGTAGGSWDEEDRGVWREMRDFLRTIADKEPVVLEGADL